MRLYRVMNFNHKGHIQFGSAMMPVGRLHVEELSLIREAITVHAGSQRLKLRRRITLCNHPYDAGLISYFRPPIGV